jgi:hypothetical protein
MTVRGGGFRRFSMALMPKGRMGPPLRSFASMRMAASWFGSLDSTGYKVAARFTRARKRAPL